MAGETPCPRCGKLLWFVYLPPHVRFYLYEQVSVGKRHKIEAILSKI
jgi:hypothetical protein